jgi:hypothetical protein
MLVKVLKCLIPEQWEESKQQPSAVHLKRCDAIESREAVCFLHTTAFTLNATDSVLICGELCRGADKS